VKKNIAIGVLFLLLQAGWQAKAQVEVFSDIMATDILRIQQLVKPDSLDHRSYLIRSSTQYFQDLNKNSGFFSKNWGFQLRNIGVTLQQNDSLGLGSNDGSFLPNVGLQQRVHVSVAARWKKLYIQLAPEFIKSENLTPTTYQLDPVYANLLPFYYNLVNNNIDLFDRIGTESTAKYNLGQSSIRYQSSHVSVGLSTENLWWGPALRNSLVLSNHASSFPHITLNSVKPLKTAFGRLEAQVVIGHLKNTPFANPDDERMRREFPWYWAPPKDTFQRVFSGYILTWEPKWTRNFYVGIAGSMIKYRNNQESNLLVFPFAKAEGLNRQRLGSFFMRYVMPKEQAEVYIEFGRSDKAAYPTNILKDSIPMGYTAGIRKFVPLRKGRSHLQFALEITRLQLPDPRLTLRHNNPYGPPNYNSWYIHPKIRQGYTNYGQVMGAWIGPGSNSQTLQVGWVKGHKKITFIGERVQHNNDFYYYFFVTPSLSPFAQNTYKYWADVSTTLQVQWDIKNVLVSAGASSTWLFNYKWTKLDGGFSGPSKLSDRRNKQLYASIVWFFDAKVFKK
jgi:hypothetical protein